MNSPIHIAISRRVLAGCEREFEDRLQAFAQRSLAEPGARGIQCLHPPAGSGSREYGIVRSIATTADRDAFYRSRLYEDWLAEIAPLVEGAPEYRDLHGLEAWFRNPSRARPARWKMALLTWVAVWPVSMVVAALLKPMLIGWHEALAAAAISAGIVVMLTWIVMPLLTKVAQAWLAPRAEPTRETP